MPSQVVLRGRYDEYFAAQLDTVMIALNLLPEFLAAMAGVGPEEMDERLAGTVFTFDLQGYRGEAGGPSGGAPTFLALLKRVVPALKLKPAALTGALNLALDVLPVGNMLVKVHGYAGIAQDFSTLAVPHEQEALARELLQMLGAGDVDVLGMSNLLDCLQDLLAEDLPEEAEEALAWAAGRLAKRTNSVLCPIDGQLAKVTLAVVPGRGTITVGGRPSAAADIRGAIDAFTTELLPLLKSQGSAAP